MVLIYLIFNRQYTITKKSYRGLIVIFNRWFLNDKKMDTLKKYLKENEINHIVVASKGGKTAIALSEELGKEANIVTVSEFSYNDKIKKTMKKKKINYIEEANLPIQDIREMRETLLMFDPGIKAALEVANIAAINKMIEGKTASIAGGGLDTVLIVDTIHPEAESISNSLKQLKIEKILFSPLV